ncbi:MAG: hypothetical protein R3B07_11650 [Polyangiaceae bacterium]
MRRETIVHLAHENQLLKRRLYGNKTERARTAETQLSFGELLKDEAALDGQLAQVVADAHSAAEASEDAAPPEPPGETKTNLEAPAEVVPEEIGSVSCGMDRMAVRMAELVFMISSRQRNGRATNGARPRPRSTTVGWYGWVR